MMTPLSTAAQNARLDTSPAEAPSKTVYLEGRYVTITGISPKHAPAMFSQVGGLEHTAIYQYLFDGPYHSLEAYTAAVEKQAADTTTIHYSILLNDGSAMGKPVGNCALMRQDLPNRVIECGHILFAPQLQRTVAATEAMYLLARYVFEDLNFRRYEWKCNDSNEPSKRAARRLGFTYEGTFRQHMFQRGKNRDTAWFSMLDSEWPARKKAFEDWFSWENFHKDGRQIKRLEQFRKEGI